MNSEVARDTEIVNVPPVLSGKAIHAYDNGHSVYLWQIEAIKAYKCWTCSEEIAGSIPHTFVRYLFPDKRGYDHHHIHNQCARDHWLPPDGKLTDCQVISYRKVPLKGRRRRPGE